MNLKCLVLFCALVSQISLVKSDCDGFLACFGSVFRDFFSAGLNSTDLDAEIVNETDSNDATDDGEVVNRTQINLFDISDLQKELEEGLSSIVKQISGAIKDEIEGKLEIESESDTTKNVNNKTDIHIKIINLSEKHKTSVAEESSSKKSNIATTEQPVNWSYLPLSDIHSNNNATRSINTNINYFAETPKIFDIEESSSEKSNTETTAQQTNWSYLPITNAQTKTDVTIKDFAEIPEKSDVKKSFNEKSNTEATVQKVNWSYQPMPYLPNITNDASNKHSDDYIPEVTFHDPAMLLGNITTLLEELTSFVVGDNKTNILANDKTDITINTEPTETIKQTDFTDNDSAIYIEPLHIDIIPDVTIERDDGIHDFVRNFTQSILKNMTLINQSFANVENSDVNLRVDLIPEEYNSSEIIKESPVDNIFDDAKVLQELLKDFNKNIIQNFTIQENRNVTASFKVKTPNNIKEEVPIVEDIEENEISQTYQEFDQYYDDIAHNVNDSHTDYLTIDYVDIYKDTTNEVEDFVPTETPTNININVEATSDPNNVIVNANSDLGKEDNTTQELRSQALPWLATVFLKNSSESQFDYNCDGAILSSNVIITAARCLNSVNGTSADDVIVILGKRSLLTVGSNERVYRIKQIKLHDKFTSNNVAGDDLALLVTDEPIVFNEDVQIAKVGGNADAEEAATTGWAITGNLTVIKFDKEKRGVCNSGGSVANTYCDTYGLDVSTCPSYGGLHLVKMDTQWLLRGIRFGNSAYKGFCIDKNVRYTDLDNYKAWIDDNVQKYH